MTKQNKQTVSDPDKLCRRESINFHFCAWRCRCYHSTGTSHSFGRASVMKKCCTRSSRLFAHATNALASGVDKSVFLLAVMPCAMHVPMVLLLPSSTKSMYSRCIKFQTVCFALVGKQRRADQEEGEHSGMKEVNVVEYVRHSLLILNSGLIFLFSFQLRLGLHAFRVSFFLLAHRFLAT